MNSYNTNNEPMNTRPNMFADAVETARFLGGKKYRIKVRGDSIILSKGILKYKISAEELGQGRNLNYLFQDSFFGGNSGIGCTITSYNKALNTASYSPTLKYYLRRLDTYGVPVDFSVIDAIYKCEPLHHNVKLSDYEREQMARGYIFGLVQTFYEYHASKELFQKKHKDKSEIHTSVGALQDYKFIPPIPNIHVSYDMTSINKISDFHAWDSYDGINNYNRNMSKQRLLTEIRAIAFGRGYTEMLYMFNRIKAAKLLEERDSATMSIHDEHDEY